MKPFLPKATSLLSYFIKGMTWTIPNGNNEIYITFDDGPNPSITPWVLKLLSERNIKATFFCIGKNVEENTSLYGEILSEGHSVGNHTYLHHSGWNSNNKGYYADIKKASSFIDSDLFRPPYGELSPIQYNHLKDKYRIIMWDTLSKDYDTSLSTEEVLYNVTSVLKSGSIIVLHDSEKAKKTLSNVLEPIIDFGLSKGFNFRSIPYNKQK